MIKVLFVCLGNICRSPMAEAVFRKKVQEANLQDKIVCDSAGTGGWHVGNPPHEGTRKILKKYNIIDNTLVARQFKNEDHATFDYIIAMDNSNISNMNRMGEQKNPNIRLLLDYTNNHKNSEVPDPYYTGNFDEVYELVSDGCESLLAEIMKEHHLTTN